MTKDQGTRLTVAELKRNQFVQLDAHGGAWCWKSRDGNTVVVVMASGWETWNVVSPCQPTKEVATVEELQRFVFMAHTGREPSG
jgi:hypothetical protein